MAVVLVVVVVRMESLLAAAVEEGAVVGAQHQEYRANVAEKVNQEATSDNLLSMLVSYAPEQL